jgi:putative membrane protein
MGQFSSLVLKSGNRPQPEKEDSTVKAASAISRAIFHHELTADEKKVAGPAVHYAFGTTTAAIYGALAEFRGSTPLAFGLPFGAAVWLGAHVITVPALGLSQPVTHSAPAAEGGEFAAHLIYGIVAEGVRRLLRK